MFDLKHGTRSVIGTLKTALGWVAERSGKRFDVWDEYNSTRTCAGCGVLGERKDPGVRWWTCSACGDLNQRDVNAARNGLVKVSLLTPCSGHRDIASRRIWRLTEAGVSQEMPTPEGARAIAA